MSDKKNPFAEEDGSPKKGQEENFFAFEKEVWEKSLSLLSEEELEEVKKAEKHLGKKMNS